MSSLIMSSLNNANALGFKLLGEIIIRTYNPLTMRFTHNLPFSSPPSIIYTNLLPVESGLSILESNSKPSHLIIKLNSRGLEVSFVAFNSIFISILNKVESLISLVLILANETLLSGLRSGLFPQTCNEYLLLLLLL